MAAEFQQHLAGGLCNPESLKAFGQMYNSQAAYGSGFLKDDKQYPMFPFFAQHFAPYTTPATSSFSPSASSTSSTSSTTQNTKKKPVPVPAEQKDESYYERRRRNNEAAKKSREQRRKQDNDNELRVRYLSEENANLKLRLHHIVVENEQMRQQLATLLPHISAQFATDVANPAIPNPPY